MKKVSYVPQLQESECGLCCVNMVMRFHGDQIPMSYLYESLEVGRDGHNLSQLRGFLEKNNYECKIYKSNVSDLEKFNGSPLIVFINNSHFVVLEKINSRNVTYVDPDIGRVKKDLSEFEAEYSGKFLFANPVVNRKKFQ
ncbi:cysteine peptidase family C39 domain-containing protein [Enterococcus gallinarum]|uniref:cysteine peptidase family C39 domain-containing protein n=1 Tax=Enterococcus gallinarum TaxID=1353 RepID=UPI00214BFFBA|nr:cysteine peptidase family C39 domain-containing protein [Enterococcus gallinarum]MCR1928446.1 cysteine peptidase family C39 domain-containing protein [Enterococcus gallinarum]